MEVNQSLWLGRFGTLLADVAGPAASDSIYFLRAADDGLRSNDRFRRGSCRFSLVEERRLSVSNPPPGKFGASNIGARIEII